jgi:signal transduction histidine kinase
MRLLRLPPATVEPQPVVVRVRSPSHAGFRGELRRGHIGGNEYLWLFRDVTVMEQARQRLEEAFDQERKLSEQLKDFDELREAFLLAVAHDLKAPLAAISAFAELLRQGRLDDVQRRSVVERLEETAAGTTRLLDDLLDYQRVTYGVTPISREKVELETLIRESAGGIPAGGHQLIYDVSSVTASLDAALTRRIVANLVTNAIKHTPAECTVWVRCRREPDGILLVVEDDGPGVPPERRTAIFDVFERDPASASGGRLGVGLALVARFAGLHGGYARVEERPGGGASFQVVLPDAAS